MTNVFGNSPNSVAAIALQADGKIVVVGWVLDGNLKSSFAIVRYDSDGTLDASFGSGGMVTTSVDRGDDLPTSVAIQRDGKIIVGGAAGASLPWNWNPLYPGTHPSYLINPRYSPVLLRYNPDGSLDSSFNGTGVDEFLYDNYPSQGFASPYLPSPLPPNDAGSINQLQIQSDGRMIVAAGPDIVRINTDGSIDRTFGQGGLVTVPMPIFEGAINDLVIQADGKILVATNSYAAENEFAIGLSRYNADGSLDTTFNHGLPVSTPVTPDGFGELTDLATQPDGTITVSATVNYLGSQSYGVLARYNSDGSLDAFFGAGGQVFEQAYGWNVVAIQSDGKLVAVGGGVLYDDGVQATSDFHVKRFNADGTDDVSFDRNVITPGALTGPAPTSPGPAPPTAMPPSIPALHNSAMPMDVNGDQKVSPADLLLIVDASMSPSTTSGSATEYLDVNGDGIVSPLDALTLIDCLAKSADAPQVASSAAQSVVAKSNANVVDNVPSTQIFPIDQALTPLATPTAGSQTSGSATPPRSTANSTPPSVTVAIASPATATTPFVLPEDFLANSDDPAEEDDVGQPLSG